MFRQLKIPERHLPVKFGWNEGTWAFVHYLIDQWVLAREWQAWEDADEFKKLLNHMGVIVEVTPTGWTWRYEKPTKD